MSTTRATSGSRTTSLPVILVELVAWWLVMAVFSAVLVGTVGSSTLLGLGWLILLLWGTQAIWRHGRRRLPIAPA